MLTSASRFLTEIDSSDSKPKPTDWPGRIWANPEVTATSPVIVVRPPMVTPRKNSTSVPTLVNRPIKVAVPTLVGSRTKVRPWALRLPTWTWTPSPLFMVAWAVVVAPWPWKHPLRRGETATRATAKAAEVTADRFTDSGYRGTLGGFSAALDREIGR